MQCRFVGVRKYLQRYCAEGKSTIGSSMFKGYLLRASYRRRSEDDVVQKRIMGVGGGKFLKTWAVRAFVQTTKLSAKVRTRATGLLRLVGANHESVSRFPVGSSRPATGVT